MEVGIAKVFAAEAIFRVVDRSVQLCGAYGVSDDSPLGWLFREVRPFRIYDGASEVHRQSIARRAVHRRPTGPRRGLTAQTPGHSEAVRRSRRPSNRASSSPARRPRC